MTRIPPPSGTFNSYDYTLKYTWRQNKVEICNGDGTRLTFMMLSKPNGFENDQPMELARQIFQEAITQGIISPYGDVRDQKARGFYIDVNRARTPVTLRSIVFPFPQRTKSSKPGNG